MANKKKFCAFKCFLKTNQYSKKLRGRNKANSKELKSIKQVYRYLGD